jgi:cell division protease FtsH
MTDVVGADSTKREAIATLNLFLANRTFTEELGGQARRGVLFEGAPGTGKTHLAKAMAGEAGVPFLFVSASAFQSMYFGQTNRKIRAFFRALRRSAHAEGGAIGFIEEFDAIGGARRGMGEGGGREGITGVVNELLVQMQSFDVPVGSTRVRGRLIDAVNLFLPAARQRPRPTTLPANVLVVAATNRASDLDPALLRPGRFDRVVHFGMPARAARAAIAAHYLARKAHAADVTADAVASITSGYTPVAVERLLDESLVCALRAGRRAMTWADVLEAKLLHEIGPAEPAVADAVDRERVAVHEAGHAVVAELLGRPVELITVLRHGEALGLVAHRDEEERSLQTYTEARSLVTVAMAGLAAEELRYGEASSGVAGDLEAATRLACHLVGAMGASGSRLSWAAADVAGAGNLVAKVLADDGARAAAEALLAESEAHARALLTAHQAAHTAVVDALLERDELSGDELRRIVGSPLPPPRA